MIPVRCYTCGKVIAQYYEEFIKGVQEERDPSEMLDSFGLTRYCCRRMLLTHVELIDDILTFSSPIR